MAEGTSETENKAINKKIKFNYFRGYLSIDENIYKDIQRKYRALEIIQNKILEKKQLTPTQKQLLEDENNIKTRKRMYDDCGRTRWLAKEMFRCILDLNISTTITVNNMPIEIEPGSLFIDEENEIVTFQLSKMRSDLLPAKKKIEKEKKDIKLDDDEYIGEFTSVLYDENLSVFMIQSNTYGLSHSQIQTYLTELRRKVIEVTEGTEMMELACELSVIINNCDIDNIKKSQEVKKIRFRAADGIYEALSSDDNVFARTRRTIANKTGYVIDITVSIDKDSEIKTIDKEIMDDIACQYENIQNCSYDPNLLVEVTRKENDDSGTEIINLLKPKMCEEISVKIKPRSSVGHGFLSSKMKEAYNVTKVKIGNILGD